AFAIAHARGLVCVARRAPLSLPPVERAQLNKSRRDSVGRSLREPRSSDASLRATRIGADSRPDPTNSESPRNRVSPRQAGRRGVPARAPSRRFASSHIPSRREEIPADGLVPRSRPSGGNHRDSSSISPEPTGPQRKSHQSIELLPRISRLRFSAGG